MSETNARAVAVVGMSVRLPGASDLESYWKNLSAGVRSIVPLTDRELLEAGVTAEQLADPKLVKVAATLPDVECFDAEYFGISRAAAELLDPQQRVLLECAVHAFEHAGHDPGAFSGPVGVYVGAGMSTYLLDNLGSRPDVLRDHGRFSILYANDKDYAATRISYHLNLRGPSMTVGAACSSSLVAIHNACLALLACECDMALAGGAQIDVSARRGYFHRDGGLTSRDGHCRPFDARAAGTVFGSGAGLLLLRRLEDALADRDLIHAVILGSAVNNDGADKVGYAAPSIRGQASVVAEALAMAEVPADTIGLLEAHGVGTPVGDSIEFAALTDAFSRDATDRERQFCALGSVKANLGHLGAAAGIAAVAKVVEAIKHRQIPPSSHFESAHPQLKLETSPFFINAEARGWPRDDLPLRAGVSAFGVGGTNAHVVLEQAPPPPPPAPACDGRARVLAISAHDQETLERLRQRYVRWLTEQRPDACAAPADFADICFTASTGRTHRRHRIAVTATSAAQAAALLDAGTGAQGCVGGVATGELRTCYRMYPIDPGDPRITHALRHAPLLFRQASQAATSLLGKRDPSQGRFAFHFAMASTWCAWGLRPDRIVGDPIGVLAGRCAMGDETLEHAARRLYEGELGAQSHEGSSAAPWEATPRHITLHCGAHVHLSGAAVPQPPPGAEPQLWDQVVLSLAQAYVLGARIQWAALETNTERRRVALPLYPFRRDRHWIDAAPAKSGEHVVEAASTREHADDDVPTIERRLLDWFAAGQTRPVEARDHQHYIDDYGADSLFLVELLARAAERYRIELTAAELAPLESVEQLARHIAAKRHGAPLGTASGHGQRAPSKILRLSAERARQLAHSYARAFAPCSNYREHLIERPDGGRTEILDMGSGPPLLLLPPLGLLGTTYLYQARALCDRFRVLIFHYSGYGRSTFDAGACLTSAASEVVCCCREFLGAGKVDVVGWSMGGFVAQLLAHAFPSFVRSLTLVNTSPSLAASDSLLELQQLLSADLERAVPAELRGWLADDPGALRASESVAVAGQYLEAVRAFDGHRWLSAIHAPALVISGARDPLTPPGQGRALAAGLSRATYQELENAGHYVPLLHADWFNRVLEGFVRGPQASAAAVS